MEQMEHFIRRILADVPPGRYRSQAEAELRDHMETQYGDLTGGGKQHREALEAVLHTMGDTEALRKEYAAAWRLREMHFFWPLYVSLLLYAAAIALTGPVYLFGDFGKAIVGLYGLVAVPLAVALMCALCARGRGKWAVIGCLCMLCAALQFPPFLCWAVLHYKIFYVLGLMVPGWAGAPVHFFLGVWGLVNFGVTWSKRRRAEPRAV